MWASLMCSVLKAKFSFDSLFTEGSFLTLNTSVKNNVAFSRGNITEGSSLTLNTSVTKILLFQGKNHWRFILWHWTIQWKKFCFVKREKHWSFTFFSEHINELKISTSDFWEGDLFSDSSRTDHCKLTCFNDCSQKQFPFFQTNQHHEEALTWNIHGLQSNEDYHSRFWMSKLFHDDE